MSHDSYFTKRVQAVLAFLGITGGGGGSSSLPVGGTTGEVLTKASNADYDAGWAAPTGGGGGGSGRILLTEDTDYYFRADGDNANDGSADDAEHAWATPNYAYHWIAKNLDLGGNIVRVNGVGTYGAISDFPGYQFVGGGVVRIKNSGAIGDLTLTSAGDVTCADIENPNTTTVVLDTIKFVALAGAATWITGSNANRIVVLNPTFVDNSENVNFLGVFFQDCVFLDLRQVQGVDGGGNTPYFYFYVGSNANCLWQQNGVEIVLTNTPAAVLAFAYAELGATMQVYGMAFTGAATGMTAFADTNASIYTGGGGLRYFPGDVDADSANGGVIV